MNSLKMRSRSGRARCARPDRRRRWSSPRAAERRRTAAAPPSEGTPKPGGTYNFPIGVRAAQHRAAEHPGSRGQRGRASVLPGPLHAPAAGDGTDDRRPRPRREHEMNEDGTSSPSRIKKGVTFAPAGQPRGHGAGLRRLLELQRRCREQVGHDLHHRSHQGHRPRHRVCRQERSHRRQGPRQLHARGHAAVSVPGLPADAGPLRSRTCFPSTTSRRSVARRSSTSRSAARARSWSRSGSTTRRSPWSRTRTTGTRPSRNPHPGYVDTINMPIYRGRGRRVARLPEGQRRLLQRPVGQRPRRREHRQGQERRMDRQDLSEHLGLLHQRLDEQAHARRRRQSADPRGPQLRRRSRGGRQRRQRGRLSAFGRASCR